MARLFVSTRGRVNERSAFGCLGVGSGGSQLGSGGSQLGRCMVTAGKWCGHNWCGHNWAFRFVCWLDCRILTCYILLAIGYFNIHLLDLLLPSLTT